jgi:hypothetical protein
MLNGEGSFLLQTDVEGRKCGEQTGFETLVVHTVNSECCDLIKILFIIYLDLFQANAISTPPEEYGRKAGTQRN